MLKTQIVTVRMKIIVRVIMSENTRAYESEDGSSSEEYDEDQKMVYTISGNLPNKRRKKKGETIQTPTNI